MTVSLPMRGCLTWSVLVAGLAAGAQAQTVTALLREGDSLPGGVTATTMGNVAANDVGGYGVGCNAGTGISAFWGSAVPGPGAVLRAEGTVGAYTQTAFEAFWGLGNSGQIAYSPTCNGGPAPTTGADTVWQDDTAIAFQGLPVTAMPGQFWSFASRPTTTSGGEPWWVSGITTTQGGSTQNRGLFRGTAGTPVLIGGSSVPGAAEVVSGSATSEFDFQVSGNGQHWIGTFTLVAVTAIDTAAVFDGAVLSVGGSPVREGTVVPVSAGGNGTETWQNFAQYGVNSAGTVLITGDTNAAATVDNFVFLGDHIIMREGDLVGGFPITGAATGADLNEAGDWAVLWNVTAGGGTRECIIFNGRLLVKETDPIDFDGDGAPDPGVTLIDITGIDNFAMSERINGAVELYFTGDTSATAGAGEAFFKIVVPVCGTADFNCDGDVGTDADIESFFACLAGSCPAAPCPSNADFNADGDIGTDADIEAFFRVLGGGAC